MTILDLLKKEGAELDFAEQAQIEEEAESGQDVLCAFCQNDISSIREGIVVNGSHDHIFANPHGLVFEVVCYNTAHGCAVCSPLTTEFTWFPGFGWRIAVCRYCAGHLGWFFQSEADSFFGLILKNLIIP